MKPSDILSFLNQLKKHNDREWFNAHKESYSAVKKEAENVAEKFIDLVAQYEPRAARYHPADCMYRIYTDIRFSKDKLPYKTHIGIFVNPPLGKKGESLGWYLHLEPGNCFMAAGTGWSSPHVLRAIRRGVYDEIEEYREIVESAEFRAAFQELGLDKLKTAPKGYDKDWEYIDYLRPRGFGAIARFDDSFLSNPDWTETLRPAVSQGARYNRFVNYFIFEALGLEN